MPLVAGVDSSTQSTTIEARDLDTGRLVATTRSPHPPTSPPVSEQDPSAWWAALSDALAQLGDLRDDVAAISVAGQQHGLVLVDEQGATIRPAKLWNDTTSAPQAADLVDRLGAEAWARACGSVPVASFTITKLAWVAEHEPEHLDATARVMLPHDWLTWRLCGRHVTDRGDASGTGWFDPAAGVTRADLLGLVVEDPKAWLDRLPRVLGPAEAAGELGPAAAADVGLRPGVVVGPGTGDNMAAALGLGLAPGDVAISLGTSGTVYSVSRVPTADGTGAVAGFADGTGVFLPLVCTLNATKVTDAVAAWLGTDVSGLAALALAASPDHDDRRPVLVPYFDGERTPNRPLATGTLAGLRTDTTREELALAAFDGVLCGLLDGLDALRAAGVATDGRTVLTGGGARSAAYRQRAADLSGGSVVIADGDEGVATGAASQAAVVLTGRSFADVASAWRLGSGRSVEPRTRAPGSTVRARHRELSARTGGIARAPSPSGPVEGAETLRRGDP